LISSFLFCRIADFCDFEGANADLQKKCVILIQKEKNQLQNQNAAMNIAEVHLDNEQLGEKHSHRICGGLLGKGRGSIIST
jgi:hypothetical protein